MGFFQSKFVKIAFAYSVVCVFFNLVESGFSLQTLTGPLKKINNFQFVLCSLKLVLIFQLDIKYSIISRLYMNLINSSKTIRLKQFRNSPSFKKMQGFKTKVCVTVDCLSFCNVIFLKVEMQSRKEIYNYRRNVLRCFFLIATEKMNAL